MQILARQNYTDVGTQTVLAKDQLGKGEICSGDAASSGFERQILTPILKRYWQKGVKDQLGLHLEIQ
jgi:hypothetical protein